MKNIYVDTRLLEIFCCVYEHGGISNTADCMHLSPSTVSFHMKQLEKSLGLKLFHSKGKKLVPTTYAHILYPYARKIMDIKLAVVEEVQLLKGSYKGYIRIGASSIPGRYLLPSLVGLYLSQNPNSNIELTVEDSMWVLKALEEGHVDIGVVGLQPQTYSLQATELWRDTIRFVGNSSVDDSISLDKLLTYPWVIREPKSGTRRVVENFLSTLGIKPEDIRVIAVVNSNEAIVEILRQVKAVSYMSSLVIDRLKQRGIRKLQVKHADGIDRSFYLVFDKDKPQSNAVRNFIQFLTSRLEILSTVDA